MVVGVCWARFNIKKCALPTQCVYLFRTIQKQRLFFLYYINRLVFRMDVERHQILPEV